MVVLHLLEDIYLQMAVNQYIINTVIIKVVLEVVVVVDLILVIEVGMVQLINLVLEEVDLIVVTEEYGVVEEEAQEV